MVRKPPLLACPAWIAWIILLKSIDSSSLPSVPPVRTPAGVLGRWLASVAFGLWQTTHTPGSSVRLLPCRLSTPWHTSHLATSTTSRRAVALPLIAASMNTLVTFSRSVNVPLVVTSPAGWPSMVTRSVPVCPAGMAMGEVTV